MRGLKRTDAVLLFGPYRAVLGPPVLEKVRSITSELQQEKQKCATCSLLAAEWLAQ